MVEKPSTGQGRMLLVIALAVIALSFSSIFITELERSEVEPSVIAFYRLAIAALLVLPPALTFQRENLAGLGRRDLALLVLGGLCLAIHFVAWITSLKYIPISTAVVLVNSHPVFVVIASYFFLGERPQRRSLIGVAIGLIGMVII